MENSTTPQWKDATTYSRDQKERVPTAWEYLTPHVRIYVTNAHRHYPDKWVLVCHHVGIDSAPLKMDWSKIPAELEIETAQQTAIRVVKSRLQKMIDSL